MQGKTNEAHCQSAAKAQGHPGQVAGGPGFITLFRRVSRNRVSTQTTDGTNSAVLQLEIER